MQNTGLSEVLVFAVAFLSSRDALAKIQGEAHKKMTQATKLSVKVADKKIHRFSS